MPYFVVALAIGLGIYSVRPWEPDPKEEVVLAEKIKNGEAPAPVTPPAVKADGQAAETDASSEGEESGDLNYLNYIFGRTVKEALWPEPIPKVF